MGMWKGPRINRKIFIAMNTKKLSKKIEILPCFLGLFFNKKIISVKLLGFKIGEFFFNKKRVCHEK
jgi:hypothetical protein